MMRFFSYLIVFISISLAVYANTEPELPVIIYSDVSAGVFRFQTKLAEKGNPEAQYKLGEMYEQGKGAKKDSQQAMHWFEKSAAQGHEKSIYKLLYLNIESNGLNKETKLQLGKLRQSAASSNANAQYFLGKMYATGTGVPKSLENALTWLKKAKFNGVDEAEHEAIAVEEELAIIKEKKAKDEAMALTAAKNKKLEADKLAKQKQIEQKHKADAAKRKAEEKEKARRVARQNQRIEEERKAQALKQSEYNKAKQAELEARGKPEPTAVQKTPEKEQDTSFKSDPCKGKSARFLSTCR